MSELVKLEQRPSLSKTHHVIIQSLDVAPQTICNIKVVHPKMFIY